MTNCLLVRAYGKQLDQLRGEASRVARSCKVDWWVESAGKGTKFCFEDSESKASFASVCKNLNIQYIE
jgi:hypothetical protein